MLSVALPHGAPRSVVWTEVVPQARALAVWRAWQQAGTPVAVIFAENTRAADGLAEDIAWFAGQGGGPQPETVVLPEMPPDAAENDPRRLDLELDRVASLARLGEQKTATRPLLVCTTPDGFYQPVPDRAALRAREIVLRAGDSIPLKQLADRLAKELGYSNETLCEAPGQLAVRGGLLDVYPVQASQPYRLDFFGDEVDGLHGFDPTTQRSTEAVEQVVIAAVPTGHEEPRARHILSYFETPVTWLLVEPDRLARDHVARFQDFERMANVEPTLGDLIRARQKQPDHWVGLTELDKVERFFPEGTPTAALGGRSLAQWRSLDVRDAFGLERANTEQASRRRFLLHLAKWIDEGWRVTIVHRHPGEEQRLKEIVAEDPAYAVVAAKTEWATGPLLEGFALPATRENRPLLGKALPKAAKGWALITGAEVFAQSRVRPAGLRKRKLPAKHQVDQLLDFAELDAGDYLVHLSHGICRYRGLTKIEIRGRLEEVISLEFEDGMLLHLPLHEAHLVSRYVGLSKSKPKLGRLGSGAFEKAKRAAEKATLDYAAELLAVQAKRDSQPGHPCQPDTHWQREFEAAFPYRETPDQLRAIGEAKADLERARPMDRLLCGDVGFGKTEIAIRIAFKMVQEGKQVVVLVPTTVLAQQHYNTFKERMAPYPMVVEQLSSFRRRDQQNEIIRQLGKGEVDIIVGTHRLLSSDIHFRDLGLVVIDEEHRFGVRHKERLKHLRDTVDVLTMSATPIPRTLYFALMGARDLSVLETPPADRLPIQTVVRPFSDEVVRSAIEFETQRGGQVFYLHNRVQTIEEVAFKLQKMFPKLRVAVGHGQMDDGELEQIMTRFVAAEYDVLVCTTIIESGLDIPNCNTLLIEGADRLGLAQLYQLRGRVGRFKRQAYAYLLLHKHAQLLDPARKRLAAIKQYSQPGAGMKIALRDLELRGAGNLLGSAQSGHIAGLGFDLYCQLLRQSIGALKGDPAARRVRAQVRLDFVTMGEGERVRAEAPRLGYDTLKDNELEDTRVEPIVAYLPASWLAEARLRLDAYRRMALANQPGEIKAMRAELEDRYGKWPEPVEALFLWHEIRTEAERAGIASVVTEGSKLKCLRASGRLDDFLKIGTRFPRLEGKTAVQRLKEIRRYLAAQPDAGGTPAAALARLTKPVIAEAGTPLEVAPSPEAQRAEAELDLELATAEHDDERARRKSKVAAPSRGQGRPAKGSAPAPSKLAAKGAAPAVTPPPPKRPRWMEEAEPEAEPWAAPPPQPAMPPPVAPATVIRRRPRWTDS